MQTGDWVPVREELALLSWNADRFLETESRSMVHLHELPTAFLHQLSDLR